MDPAIFFPEVPKGAHNRRYSAEAKAICQTCPVRHECLRTALERREEDGIWGGFNPSEREVIRRLKRRLNEPYESLVAFLERKAS